MGELREVEEEIPKHINFITHHLEYESDDTEPLKQYIRRMIPILKQCLSEAWDVAYNRVTGSNREFHLRVIADFLNDMNRLDFALHQVAVGIPISNPPFNPINTYYGTPLLDP